MILKCFRKWLPLQGLEESPPTPTIKDIYTSTWFAPDPSGVYDHFPDFLEYRVSQEGDVCIITPDSPCIPISAILADDDDDAEIIGDDDDDDDNTIVGDFNDATIDTLLQRHDKTLARSLGGCLVRFLTCNQFKVRRGKLIPTGVTEGYCNEDEEGGMEIDADEQQPRKKRKRRAATKRNYTNDNDDSDDDAEDHEDEEDCCDTAAPPTLTTADKKRIKDETTKLNKVRKQAVLLKGLTRHQKKLMKAIFPAEILQHWHDDDGVWNGNECLEAGGMQPLFEQILHVIMQIEDGFDKEEDKLKMKEGVILPFLAFMMMLCGVDNVEEPGTTTHLMGVIPEVKRDELFKQQPTGKIMDVISSWWPHVLNGISYGNGQEFIVAMARNVCHRKQDKYGNVYTRHKHCNPFQVPEAEQTASIIGRLVEVLPAYTEIVIINGGGSASDLFFYHLAEKCYSHDNIITIAFGTPHLSGFGSVSNFKNEGIMKNLVKFNAHAMDLSLKMGFVKDHLVSYCGELEDVEVDNRTDEALIDVMRRSQAASIVPEDPNEMDAAFEVAKRRHKEMSTKGGSARTARKAAAVKVNGRDGNQIKLLKYAKYGVNGTSDAPTDETKQLYYAECRQPGCLGLSPTRSFVTAVSFDADGNAKFRARCTSCGGGIHRNWQQIGEALPCLEPPEWTLVGPVDDEICGDGLPGLIIGSSTTGGSSRQSYESYGCGAKACVKYTSNYGPEYAYFCKKCESKLPKADE